MFYGLKNVFVFVREYKVRCIFYIKINRKYN